MSSSSPRRYSPLWHLVLTRWREFFRVPEAVFWVYGFPLLIAVALGIAFRNRPVEKILVDVQKGTLSQSQLDALLQRLKTDERIQVKVVSAEEGKQRLQRGKTDIIVAPQSGAESRYEYWYEPNRPESVMARSIVDGTLVRAEAQKAPKIEDKVIEAKGWRYIDFLIPGLLGMNLMSGGLWGVGFVIVDLRVRKLLKRYIATPMRKHDFLMSLALSRLTFTIPEVLILLTFAYFAFSVGIAGNLFLLLGVVLLGAASFACIGLLVASRVARIESVSGLMNLVMLPMFVLSGVFFASDRFPDAMQPFIKALPLTALNDALRGVMLDGAGVVEIGNQLLILLGWGAVCFILAMRMFRWK